MTSKLDWQGHRGSRGILPENTIPSFISAINDGVSTIEMDVVISQDLQVVVSHEPYFSSIISTPPDNIKINKENERAFNIYKMPYHEIKKWDVGLKNHPDFPLQKNESAYKPLLSETFRTIETYLTNNNLTPVNYSIEIKSFAQNELEYHPEPILFSKLVLDTIHSFGLEDRTIIQAFDKRIIEAINSYDMNINCSFLFQGDQKDLYKELKSLDIYPTIIGPQYKLVDVELIQYCHQNQLKVIPWTINELSIIKDLILMGVDGIITDFPQWLEKLNPFLNSNNKIIGSII